MKDHRIYRVGHEYTDDIANSREKDQFIRWLPGIKNSGGIRYARYKHITREVPAFIVLITREISRKNHNPWEDVVDYGSSTIFYWGDAKYHFEKDYTEFPGNKTLMKVYEKYLERKYREVPPILHFSKKTKGTLIFNGLCVISNVETTWFEDLQRPVKNYRFHLTVLDAHEVDTSWLLQRADNLSKGIKDSPSCPLSWKLFQKGQVKKIKIVRGTVRSRDNQLPGEKTPEAAVLSELVQLKAEEFEAVLVELLKSLELVSHNVTRTRFVRDGGFDFYGEFDLPYPFSYKIEFLGEAKKYKRNNPVGPGEVSRLVARLGRGQYGIFFTTSYFSKQAQEEVLKDKYPIRLYSGIDIINFFRELKLIEKDKIKQSWLKEVVNRIAE